MLISYILMMLLIISTLGKKCDHIACSNVFDEVCGIAEVNDRTQIRLIYKNYCHMKKAECEEESFVEINQVENEFCNLTQRRIMPNGYQDVGRRVSDFSIVGAHQACNHTCPTSCTDTYEPACAKIWLSKTSVTTRPMINHCHIDLFSCVTGRKVTIEALVNCYQNANDLLFMQNVAAMKSLKLLDFDPKQENNRRRNAIMLASSRRATALRDEAMRRDEASEISFKNHLKEIVRRIFEKYRNRSEQNES